MHHLFFDLDGTLTDPAPGITGSLAYALRRLGRPEPSLVELRRFIGPPLREVFAELLATADAEAIEEAVGLYRERFSSVGLFENAVYPGIEASLEQLGTHGFALSIVTSKPEPYANQIIDHFGLRRFFPGVYGAELSGERSSKSELVAHALASERLGSLDVGMIGDRRHDVAGAQAHGVAAIGVTWGYGTPEELREAGAARVVHSVSELAPTCRDLRAQLLRPR